MIKEIKESVVNEITGAPEALKMVAKDFACLYAMVAISGLIVAASGVQLVANAITRITQK